MKTCVVLLLLCLSGWAIGQTPKADSLRALLQAQSRADTTRVRRLQALARALSGTDAARAETIAHQALKLARQLEDLKGQSQALLSLSNLARRRASFEPARRYAQQAKVLFIKQNNLQGQAKSWLQLSLICILQGNPRQAIAAALQGLQLAEKAGDVETQARLQANLGDIYTQIGDYDEALPMLRAALRSSERTADHQAVLSALNGIGNTYQKLQRWPQALKYYERALRLSRQIGDAMGEAGNETGLAEVYSLQGNQAAALAHGLRARQLVRATHDDYNLPLVELALARAYVLARQPDSALALAQHSLQLSQQTRSNETIRNAGDILAQAYAQQGNFAQAYRYRNLQMAYTDTLSGEETQRRTSALRYSYELDKKQTQIDLLTKTRQLQAQKAGRQRLLLYGLLTGLVGVMVIVGLLLRNILLKLRINRHLNETNVQIAAHRDELGQALTALKNAQTRLVQHEKMASLGELTAGVAHEIQNPLNFVTNFSELNLELVAELEAELAQEALSQSGRQLVTQLLGDLNQNQAKIHEHGQRADRIVKRMLEHSRTNSGERQATDLNALSEECLRLAYHGWRAKNKDFNVTLTTDYDPALMPIQVVAQDLNRVLVNLLTNAFYAVAEKSRQLGPAYSPEVQVHTRLAGNTVQIRVRDNGSGIPAAVRNKIFQPFFTTKPTGEGTGLGLSLSYDIITKGHGGVLSVESQEGEYTEFTIGLSIKTEVYV